MVAEFQSVIGNWEIGEISSVSAFTTDKYRSSGNVSFVDSDRGRFVLKRLPGGDGSEPLFTALPQLRTQGIPVAAPIATRHGALWVSEHGSIFSLAPFLPGAVVTDHYSAGVHQRSFSFGSALARLHRAFCCVAWDAPLQDMDLLGQIRAIHSRSTELGLDLASIAVLAETVEALEVTTSMKTQVIHRDSHASNVLFTHDNVCGWLDFELTTVGPRLFDLCYYSTSVLMDALTDPARQGVWLEIVREGTKGYHRTSALTEGERHALPYILLSIEAIFIAYFAGIGDRKGVDMNLRALRWLHDNRGAVRTAVDQAATG